MSHHRPSRRLVDQEIRGMHRRIANHKRCLDRMTVQGFPSQAATDLLNKMCAELILMEHRAQLSRL
jgi:hypothetical protein